MDVFCSIAHATRPQLFCRRGIALTCLLVAALVFETGRNVRAQQPADEGLTFEKDVLPIFRARCTTCHGDKPKAGLVLDRRSGILKGGVSGPAIRIAAAESSLLWEKIASNEMPAAGPPLTAEQKGVIRKWINDGAPGADATHGDREDDAEPAAGSDSWWSFHTPVRPKLPTRGDGVDSARSPIDAFVLEKLTASGLNLSAEAGRQTLIRRLSFDVIGLPPSPDEVTQFAADPAPDAYDRLLDRLLASPRHGERWGRHWLDLAGYADSAGVLAEDRPLPTAFRYRDYVIRALNADKPYDRFLQEQLAGDELANYWESYETADRLPDEVVEAVTATGFLRCAADSSRPDFSTIKNADAQYFYPTLNDTLQIVASSTMGLTLQCARCHSHKYDPIPQVEYYRLQAIFMAALRPSRWIPQMERRILVASAREVGVAEERNRAVQEEIARLQQQLAELKAQYKTRLTDDRLAALPETIRDDVRQAVAQTDDQQSVVARYLAEKFRPLLDPDDATLDKVLPETYRDYQHARETSQTAIAEQERRRMAFDELRALYDLPGEFATPLLRRGDPLTPGPPVSPGVLSALHAPEPFQWTPPATDAKTSGRRLAFARWLTQPGHPLTARVMVNRAWLHHFGEGLVPTPEDLGHSGALPSHPQLLDWLACELVDSGWSLKHLHRLILRSSVYRQSSRVDTQLHTDAMTIDPENRLLWRQRLRRLDAEPLRDALLDVAGQLDRRMFGAPTPMARRPDGEVTAADGANDRRRSIYLQVLRSNPLTVLQAFDQPVMETNCVRRARSTVSTQALTLLNSDRVVGLAGAFAERMLAESPNDPVGRTVLCALGREPAPDERSLLEQFTASQQAHYSSRGEADGVASRNALADLCHMLLSTNEFVYLD